MKDNTSTVELLHAQALHKLNEKNYEEAKECLLRIIELEPHQERYKTEIAFVYHVMACDAHEIGHHKKALEYSVAACKYDPNNQSYKLSLFALYIAICSKHLETSVDNAYEYLKPLLALNISKNSPIRKIDQLEFVFTQTCTNFIMKAMLAEKYEQVNTVLPKIIAQGALDNTFDTPPLFIATLGTNALMTSRYDNAIQIYSIALNFFPDNGIYKSSLAHAYEKLGGIEHSKGNYLKALDAYFSIHAVAPRASCYPEYISSSIIDLKNKNFVSCDVHLLFLQVLKCAQELKDSAHLNFMLLYLMPFVKHGVYDAKIHLAEQETLTLSAAKGVQVDINMMNELNTILKGKNNIEMINCGTEISFSDDAVALIKENLHLWTSLFSLQSSNISFKKEDIQFSQCAHLLEIPGCLATHPYPPSSFDSIQSDVTNRIGLAIFAKYKLSDLHRAMFASKESIGSYCKTLMKEEMLIFLCSANNGVQDSNVETPSISLPTEVIQLILEYMANFYMLKAIMPQQ